MIDYDRYVRLSNTINDIINTTDNKANLLLNVLRVTSTVTIGR